MAGTAGYDVFMNPQSKIANRQSLGPVLTTDKSCWLTNAGEKYRPAELTVAWKSSPGTGALGHEIPLAFADKQVERTRTMGAYKASTLIDFEQGRALELESLFLEPLRQARKAGAKSHQLEACTRPRVTSDCRGMILTASAPARFHELYRNIPRVSQHHNLVARRCPRNIIRHARSGFYQPIAVQY